MAITFNITIKKKHIYILSLIAVLALAGGLVTAFGTNSPATFGHSSGELSISLAKLQSVVSSDFHNLGGSDANTQCDDSTCGQILTNTGIDSTSGTVVINGGDDLQVGSISSNHDISIIGANRNFALQVQNGGSGNGKLVIRDRTGSANIMEFYENGGQIVVKGPIQNDAASLTLNDAVVISSTLNLNGGSNIIRRTTGCPSFNYLTTDGSAPGCTSVIDTGLRVS